MPPDTLRERLTTAFLDASIGLDTIGAYDRADVVLKVFKDHATIADLKHEKVVGNPIMWAQHGYERVFVTCSCDGFSGVWSTPDDDATTSAFGLHLEQVLPHEQEPPVADDDQPSFDSTTDNCPECDAAPGETCGIEIALLHGYPGPVGDCPRDPA